MLVPVLAMAQTSQEAKMVRDGKTLHVSMDMTLDRDLVQYTHAYILTPVLCGESDTLALKPVGYFSKDKFYHFLPEAGVPKEQSFTKSDLPVTYSYHDSVPYKHWMNGASLKLVRSYQGCCGDTGSEADSLNRFDREPFNFTPEYLYLNEADEIEKVREQTSEVIVYFPLNSTKLNQKYLDNPTSLGVIENDIDQVRNNPDFTINSITLKSTSSPEGRYDVNARLSEGRVNAIRDYVSDKMNISGDILKAESVAEDWDGLRAFVAASNLSDADELLAIIDSNDDPDVKEKDLRAHAASWRVIAKECLPVLRKTAYKVEYAVRSYTDVAEIKKQIKEHPENVSLKEFYTAASTEKPGSPEFIAIYREALKQYPNDPTANLNAANAEMEEGNLAAAAPLLEKAGNSPEAEWARAQYCCLTNNYGEAAKHAQKAADGGIKEAEKLLDDLDR